jgi:hypothetical protein
VEWIIFGEEKDASDCKMPKEGEHQDDDINQGSHWRSNGVEDDIELWDPGEHLEQPKDPQDTKQAWVEDEKSQRDGERDRRERRDRQRDEGRRDGTET